MSEAYDVRWYWFESCYTLYLWTLHESSKEHEDYDDVIQYLKKMEGVRPEDIKENVNW